MTGDIVLKVLLFRREGDLDTWIAQGLQHNIVAHGPDVEHAKRAFVRTVRGYIELATKHGQDPLASIRPADQFFWNCWKEIAAPTVLAERLQSTDAYMLPVVNNDPIPAGQH